MRPAYRANKRNEGGFTLVELMIAAVVSMIIMVVAFSVLAVAQKEERTTQARSSDTDTAQQALTRMENAVRFATQVAVSSDASQLWIYNSANSSNTVCTEWFYTSGTNGTLSMASGSGSGSLGTAAIEARGVFQTSGSPGVFTGVSGFNGLVDVSFSVLQNGSLSQSTTGTAVSVSITDQNMVTAVLATSSPQSVCP